MKNMSTLSQNFNNTTGKIQQQPHMLKLPKIYQENRKKNQRTSQRSNTVLGLTIVGTQVTFPHLNLNCVSYG